MRVYHESQGRDFCTSTANSSHTGGARIEAWGSPSLAANDLTLFASCVPDEVSRFFYGTSQQHPPIGNGHLCVGGRLTRVGTAGQAPGYSARRVVDLVAADITSIGTLYFQRWFRDPAAGGATFDTRHGLGITFVP